MTRNYGDTSTGTARLQQEIQNCCVSTIMELLRGIAGDSESDFTIATRKAQHPGTADPLHYRRTDREGG